jgi:uncharacterized protein (TIGR03437 family)
MQPHARILRIFPWIAILFGGLTSLQWVSPLAQAQAIPIVTSVVNSASNVRAQLPGSGIAQGSLFVAQGTSLGPASIVIAASFPLSTSIAGTSVKVTVGGVTRDAIMYYSSAQQIAAILPSSVPVGKGTFTVSYNGSTSTPFPITVVKTTIGVFTLNTSGGGDAIATLGNSFVGPLNAANPGDVVALWATGLGPVSGDETQPATQVDMPDIPVQAWVAGKPADVLFRGRNGCCSSVDTIYLRIPAGVSGCVTPVVFQTGDYVSNTTTIPVAPSGHVCAPNVPGFQAADVQALFAKPTLSYAAVGLFRGGSIIGNELVAIIADGANGIFARTTPLPGGWGATNWDVVPPGSCLVNTGGAFNGAFLTFQWLDGGASLNISGAGGLRSIPQIPPPLILSFAGQNYFGALDFPGNYLKPGTFTVTVPGGKDVGPFTASINYPEPILQWTNQRSITSIDRAQGTTVTWTGGDPNGLVEILGFSTTAGNRAAGSAFVCTARTSDQSFTVPPYVTLAMAPSNPTIPAAIFPSSLWVLGFSAPTRFQATGVDLGVVNQWSNEARTVNYTGATGIP